MFGRKDPYDRLAEFRHSLLAASRAYPNPEFEPLMNQASHADLEWLIVRIDESLAEAPRHVEDRARLAPIQARFRLTGP